MNRTPADSTSTSGAAPAPSGTLTPYIIVKGAAKAIEFYVRVFGAVEQYRLTEPGGSGKLGHAELAIGAGRLMLADEFRDFGALAPSSVGGTPVSLHLEVADVDAVVARAASAGATIVRSPKDEFFGERRATIVDPFGHCWFVGTPKEAVTPAEMQRRWNRMMAQG